MKFKGVYTDLRQMKLSAARLDVDLDKSFNDESKGVISDELAALRQSYMNLYNTDVTMTTDITAIRTQVSSCLGNAGII